MAIRLLLVAMLAAACSSTPGQPTPPGQAPTQPAAPGGATPAAGGPASTEGPPGGGPVGGTQIVLEVGGRSITLPSIALCHVTDESVELSASAAGGAAGVTVSWRADQPPAQASIIYVDLASAITLVAGPDVSADSPPQFTVRGETVEIIADVHDPALNRPSQNIRLLASCPETAGDKPLGPTGGPSVIGGRANVQIGDKVYEFAEGELCVVSGDQVSVHLTAGEASSLNITVVGNVGFLTVTLPSAQWTSGFTGEPVQFSVIGSVATWSGTVIGSGTGTEQQASVTVECTP